MLVLVARGAANAAGENIFMRFEPPLAKIPKCSNSSRLHDACWTVNTRNWMTYDPAVSDSGSFLYISKNAYAETASYLQQDVLSLPPKCTVTSNIKCAGAVRMEALMLSISRLQQPRKPSMTGNGLTMNAFKDVLLSSLVEPLWTQSLGMNETLVKRVFMSTTRGIYRTRSSPMGNKTFNVPFLYAPNKQHWYYRAQGMRGRVVLSPPVGMRYEDKAAITMSQAIRHGYSKDLDSDFGLGNTAAVLGAELDYDVFHGMLYGSKKMAGRGNQSTCICGNEKDPNQLLCFVLDHSAALLFHPDKNVVVGEANRRRPRFFGELESEGNHFRSQVLTFMNKTQVKLNLR